MIKDVSVNHSRGRRGMAGTGVEKPEADLRATRSQALPDQER